MRFLLHQRGLGGDLWRIVSGPGTDGVRRIPPQGGWGTKPKGALSQDQSRLFGGGLRWC